MKKSVFVPIIIAAATLIAACSSSSSNTARTTEPRVDKPGKTISRYSDTMVEVIVDYKFANNSIGDDWMILNVAVTGW